jgi:hypothetical protein
MGRHARATRCSVMAAAGIKTLSNIARGGGGYRGAAQCLRCSHYNAALRLCTRRWP